MSSKTKTPTKKVGWQARLNTSIETKEKIERDAREQERSISFIVSEILEAHCATRD